MRNATIAALLTLVISQAASAQVFSRSTPGPDRTAAGEAWYASRSRSTCLATTTIQPDPRAFSTVTGWWRGRFSRAFRSIRTPHSSRTASSSCRSAVDWCSHTSGGAAASWPGPPAASSLHSGSELRRSTRTDRAGTARHRGGPDRAARVDAGNRRVVHARARGHDWRQARRGRHRHADGAAAAASWRRDHREAAGICLRGVGELRRQPGIFSPDRRLTSPYRNIDASATTRVSRFSSAPAATMP